MNSYVMPGVTITPQQVTDIWERHYNVKLERIIWKDKSTEMAVPRHVLCYVLKKYAQVEKSWIGGYLHRDRITVHNSINVVRDTLLHDAKHREKIENLMAELDAASSKPSNEYTITVKLHREDFKKLMPKADPFKLQHWNLESLWKLYLETTRYIVKGNPNRGISGKSTLT